MGGERGWKGLFLSNLGSVYTSEYFSGLNLIECFGLATSITNTERASV